LEIKSQKVKKNLRENNPVFNSYCVDLQVKGARPKTCYGTGVEEGW